MNVLSDIVRASKMVAALNDQVTQKVKLDVWREVSGGGDIGVRLIVTRSINENIK